MQYHHYSLTEIELMLPWERRTYIALVGKHVQEENERIKAKNEEIAAANRRKKK